MRASVLGVSWQHLNHSALLVRSVYPLDLFFHAQIIRHDYTISFPNRDGFSKFKHSYIKSACYSTRDKYGANANEI